MVAPEEAHPLRTGEHVAVKEGERDPLGVASRLSQGLQHPCSYLVAVGRLAILRPKRLFPGVHVWNGEEPFAGGSTSGQYSVLR